MKASNPYRPAIIAWPKLSPVILQRVTSLPIWDVAVHTESRARLQFAFYANSVASRGFESARHAERLGRKPP